MKNVFQKSLSMINAAEKEMESKILLLSARKSESAKKAWLKRRSAVRDGGSFIDTLKS